VIKRKKIIAKRLGEVLIERGLISHDQLDDALKLQKTQKGLVGEILVKLGHVTEDSIAWSLAVQYGLAYLPLKSYEMSSQTVKLIPKELAQKYGLVGIDQIGKILTVAMTNPLDNTAIDEVEKATKFIVRPFIGTHSDIFDAINRCYAEV